CQQHGHWPHLTF
nr:immunoglobulin light chain junction region [Macaca mulatta]